MTNKKRQSKEKGQTFFFQALHACMYVVTSRFSGCVGSLVALLILLTLALYQYQYQDCNTLVTVTRIEIRIMRLRKDKLDKGLRIKGALQVASHPRSERT
jgi:hypothetical protein